MTGTWPMAAAGAAVRCAATGEGDGGQWRAHGLLPYPDAAGPDAAGPDAVGLGGIVLATAAPGLPEGVTAAFGHPCLGRSGGDPADLPVSAVWEVALVWMAARALGVPARIGLCTAEEILQFPAREAEFLAFGDRLATVLRETGDRLGVPTTVTNHTSPPARVPQVPDPELYGLFTPFGTGTYPQGFPGADAALEAFRWYCGRYADAVAEDPGAVLVEGVHLTRAARIGLGPSRRHLLCVPLPDPGHPGRLLQDAPARERLTLARAAELPAGWWPEETCAALLGIGLRELTLLLAEALDVPAAPAIDRERGAA